MKSIIKTKIIAILALIIFTNTPFVAFTADMWAETPDIRKDMAKLPFKSFCHGPGAAGAFLFGSGYGIALDKIGS